MKYDYKPSTSSHKTAEINEVTIPFEATARFEEYNLHLGPSTIPSVGFF